MGRATIIGGGSDGLYTVQADYGSTEKTRRMAALDARITEAEQQQAAQQEIVDTYDQRLDELLAEQDAAIDALAIASEAEAAQRKKDLEQKTGEVLVVRKALDQARTAIKMTEATLAGLRRAKAQLAAVQTVVQMSAWCADYTEDGGGEVATIEIPGEPAITVLAPTCRPPNAGDGKVVKRELQSAEQVFFNAAILPGWQKHQPTYRAGTLVAKDDETNLGTVALDATPSSAQSLGINKMDTLAGIPFQYMTCNSRAFEEGDHVVVRMGGSWSGPTIIGFVSNPRPCIFFPQYVVMGADDEVFAEAIGTTSNEAGARCALSVTADSAHIVAPCPTSAWTSEWIRGYSGVVRPRFYLTENAGTPWAIEEEEAGLILFSNASPTSGTWIVGPTDSQGIFFQTATTSTLRLLEFAFSEGGAGYMKRNALTYQQAMALMAAPETLTVRHIESGRRALYRRMAGVPATPQYPNGGDRVFNYELERQISDAE